MAPSGSIGVTREALCQREEVLAKRGAPGPDHTETFDRKVS